MALNFEKYAEEGNRFIKELANNLGHPDEIARTGIILRSVLHTLRDRIDIGESLNLISTFPMAIKAIYVDGWKYRRTTDISSKQEFFTAVEAAQKDMGERQFNWQMSTEDIVRICFATLRQYIPDGEIENITDQLPDEMGDLFEINVYHQ